MYWRELLSDFFMIIMKGNVKLFMKGHKKRYGGNLIYGNDTEDPQ